MWLHIHIRHAGGGVSCMMKSSNGNNNGGDVSMGREEEEKERYKHDDVLRFLLKNMQINKI